MAYDERGIFHRGKAFTDPHALVQTRSRIRKVDGAYMTIFTVVVTSETEPGGFQAMLDSKFSDNFISVAPRVWLVAGTGSVQAMSQSLGITDGSVANGLVTAIRSYFGRAPTNIWDWIKAKWEETSASE